MADPSHPPPPTLLTFAPMVDSEMSRLLLRYYAVPYRERDHLFGWVSLLTLFHGGYGPIPLLYRRGLRKTGPRAIAERLDADLPPEQRLIPAPGPLSTQVEADWKTYNGGIGADMARFAYYHLLPERRLMQPIFAAPVPRLQAWLLPVLYPALRGLFSLLLWLTAKRAEEAYGRIRATFAETDKRIADGRRYLDGDRLTLADLALASASAPLLQPPGYGAKMPAPEEMPSRMRAAVEELRATPTGAFVKRLYEEGFVRPT